MFVRAKQISNYNGHALGVRMNCRRTLLPVSGGKCGHRGISDRADAGFHGEERGPDAKSAPDRQQLRSARDGGGCQPHKRRSSAKNHRWAALLLPLCCRKGCNERPAVFFLWNLCPWRVWSIKILRPLSFLEANILKNLSNNLIMGNVPNLNQNSFCTKFITIRLLCQFYNILILSFWQASGKDFF